MKARVTKQRTRPDDTLLAFQTDGDRSSAIEPNTDANGHGAADQQSRSRANQGRYTAPYTHAEQEDGIIEVERSEGHTS